MIFLATPNMFQLRLGWLVRAAHQLATQSLNRSLLGEALLQEAIAPLGNEQVQDGWLRQTGLVRKPFGRLSPRAVEEIVRMCVTYGIYEPEAQALTDLGRVLHAADVMVGAPSPFTWQSAKKFVGLRLLMGTDGDVTLALLRAWPDLKEEQPADAAPIVAACLKRLAETAHHEDDRKALLAQSQKERTRDLVWPRLEPLRELGYFDLGAVTGEYRLTATGRRLRLALQDAPDASSLLRAGLSKAFIWADDVEPEGEAPPQLLLETLKDLPPGLRGAAQEAPLEAVVLLAQCRLLSNHSKQWIDLSSAEQAVISLSQQLGGRIGIKAGTSTRTQNITWANEQVLTGSTEESVSGGQGSGGPDRAEVAVPLAPSEGVQTESAMAPPPSLPVQLTPPPSAPLRLWLALVARLLDPPSLGGADGVQNGGLWTWCDALLRSLERPPEVLYGIRQSNTLLPGNREREGLKPWGRKPLATLPLRKGLHLLGSTFLGLGSIQRALDIWEQPPPSSRADGERPTTGDDLHALRLALRRAREVARQQFPIHAAAFIRAFLKQPSLSADLGEWEPVAEATRALIEDAITRGLGSRAELADRMRRLLEKAGSDVAHGAEDVLSALAHIGQRSRFRFIQDIIVPERIANALKRVGSFEEPYVRIGKGAEAEEVFFSVLEKSLEPLPDKSRWLQASGQVLALDAARARHRAAELARDGLARVSFEASRILPPGEDHESSRAEFRMLRLVDVGDNLIPEEDPAPGEPVWLLRPVRMGFAWKAPRPSLREELAALPTLEKLERTGAVDARARVARAIHWLGIAEQMDARPPDRLARAWIAVEHLVAEGLQTKGPVVIRHLADAAVIEQMLAFVGGTMREVLAALHLNACVKPEEPGIVERLGEALRTDEVPRYRARPSILLCTREALNPPAETAEFSDLEALELFSRWHPSLAVISSLIEPESPYAAWRLRKLKSHFESNKNLNDWLQGLRLDAATLLQHVYDLRNQFVHDADPFVFEESHRLQDLYIRFRGLIDPLLSALLQRLTQHQEGPSSLAVAWAELEARYAELHHVLESGKEKHPPDLAFLLNHLKTDM